MVLSLEEANSFPNSTMPGGKRLPTKSPKLRGQSRSKSPGKGKGKKKSGKKTGSAKIKTQVDILSPAAMTNLHYIAHGPVDALEMRGFGWTGSAGGKKKKGKKGKKKK